MTDLRPRTSPLVFGVVFLLIGGLAIAADLTTLDADWILPSVLLAAGLLSLVLVLTRRR